MNPTRLDSFRLLVAQSPNNALARFGLANEALKAGLLREAVENLQAYLSMHEDEGNGYGRLADALAKLGRLDEAKAAYQTGIETARRFGHPGMASDFEERLAELNERE